MITGNAYIIHIKAYRETSAFVDYLFEDHGIIRAIAKGVKTKKSKLKQNLQPFRLLHVNLAGKRDLKIVASHDCLNYHIGISQDKLIYAMYANEVLSKLARANKLDHEFLFKSYGEFLGRLESPAALRAAAPFEKGGRSPSLKGTARSAGDAMDAVLRKFELNLLKSLGFGLQLETEFTTGRPIENNKYYFYDFNRGPCICENTECSHKNCYLGSVFIDLGKFDKYPLYEREKPPGANALSPLYERGDNSPLIKGGSGEAAGVFYPQTKKLLKSAINYYLDNKKLITRETVIWEAQQ